eukprot:3625901-Rhodomonas_salina.2
MDIRASASILRVWRSCADAKVANRKNSFFDGWFVRIVDHKNDLRSPPPNLPTQDSVLILCVMASAAA